MHIYFTKENVVHHLTFNMNIELEQIKHFCFVLITLKIISLLGNGHYDIRESKIGEQYLNVKYHYPFNHATTRLTGLPLSIGPPCSNFTNYKIHHSWCLPYAGFFLLLTNQGKKINKLVLHCTPNLIFIYIEINNFFLKNNSAAKCK